MLSQSRLIASSQIRVITGLVNLDFGAAVVPQLEIRRWRKNPLPRRPVHAHWDRLKLLELAKPIYNEPYPTTQNLWKECPKVDEQILKKQQQEANELEVLYAKELRNLLDTSPMIGLFHANSIKLHPDRRAWQNARRHGMELKKYNKKICKEAFKDSKWEALLFFTENQLTEQRFVFSQTIDPKAIFAYEKKVPEFHFMAAIVENRLLDRAGMLKLQNLPTIDVLRGELCSILQMPAQKTLRLLQANQQNLSTNLSQYVKDQQEQSPEQ